MTTALFSLAGADTTVIAHASATRLTISALIGMALIVLLITRLRMNPFISLTLGALTVAACAGADMNAAVKSYTTGFGATAASVGTLVALGAIFGKLMADSGAADEIVDTIVGKASPRALPWAMAAVGALIGLPMFFEIGLVLLMPVIYLVARRSGQSLVRIGIPTMAGLSVMHGFVPPHPGPLAAVSALKANLGITLGLGVLLAIPTLIVAGPLFGRIAGRWVDVPAPDTFESRADTTGRRPGFAVTICTVLLPVVLMMGSALADIFISNKKDHVRVVLDFLGTPLIALLIAALVAMVTFGRGAGWSMKQISSSVESSLPPMAGIILIVAGGGGFKQVLIDTGIGKLLADGMKHSGLSVLLLAWLVAVVIRLATGSATVATVTTAGIVAPLISGMSQSHVSLMVIAIGSGSLFFSHVNDAGFWLVKEYFKLDVAQTFKSWSIMETIISVMGIVTVLLASLVV